MTGTKPSNGIDLQRAKLELDQYGFTMLPNLLARDAALEMAEKADLPRTSAGGRGASLPIPHITVQPSRFRGIRDVPATDHQSHCAQTGRRYIGRGLSSSRGSDVKWTRPGTAASGPQRRRTYGLVRRTESASSREYLLHRSVQLDAGRTSLERMARQSCCRKATGLRFRTCGPTRTGNLRFMNDRVRQLRREVEEGDPNGRLAAAEGTAGSAVVFPGRHVAPSRLQRHSGREQGWSPYAIPRKMGRARLWSWAQKQPAQTRGTGRASGLRSSA